MELLDRETFLEWMERIMKRFDDLKQTTAPLYGEPQTKKEETVQRHVISDYTQQQSPRFVVMTSRGLPFECDDNITDYIFGLTTNTFSARDGGSPSIEGCVAEILCPLLSNGLSV